MKNAKKILSTICALSMAVSSAQGITAFAADIDYTVRKIDINGTVLGEGEKKSVDEIKTAIKALGEVNFENYATQKAAVIAIAESINLLSDEDKKLLDVEMDDDPDVVTDTYWKTILDATFVIEAGETYDAIKNKIPSFGEEYPEIIKANYKDCYDAIMEIGADFDNLTDGAQKMLSSTAFLYKWDEAVRRFNNFSTTEKTAAAEALKKVVTDVAGVSTENYTEKESLFKDAQDKYSALIPSQQEEVDAELTEKGSEILAKGEKALKDFKENMLAKINDGVSEAEITFENYSAVAETSAKSLELYNALIALDSAYTDDALKTKIDNYIAVSDYYGEVKGLEDKGISAENYTAIKPAADNLAVKHGNLTPDQQAMSVAAKTALDKILADWNSFKDGLVDDAIDKINAIDDFDYNTWEEDNAKWKQIKAAIADAEKAIKTVEAYVSEVTNKADFDAKKDLYSKIEETKGAAIAYLEKVEVIGTVGDLATDSITLESGDKIEAAENAYDALTDELKNIGAVKNAHNEMILARTEFDKLADQEGLIVDALKTFENGISALNLGYKTLPNDVTGEDIKSDVDAVSTNYENASNFANDANYGTKLLGLITADIEKKYTDLHSQANAIIALRVSGEKVLKSGDSLFTLLGIDENTPKDAEEGELSVKSAIEEFIAKNPGKAGTLIDEIAAMGTDVAAYDKQKDTCKNLFSESFPKTEKPYKGYESYVDQYNVISDVHEALNPTEAMKSVDDWAKSVDALFNNVEEECIAKTAEEKYNKLSEQWEAFENIERYYAQRNHGKALSEFVYVEFRIGQYRQANAYVKTVEDLMTAYNGLDAIRATEGTGETDYGNALRELTTKTDNAVSEYGLMILAVTEITGVKDAYDDAYELAKILVNRNAAFDFDNDVAAVAGQYSDPASGFAAEQAKYTALWTKYGALNDAQKEFVTKKNLLIETEAKIVKLAIDALDNTDDFDTAVKEADECYAKAADETKQTIDESHDKLIEYLKVSAFRNDIAAVEAGLDKDTVDSYITKVNNLYEFYNANVDVLKIDGPKKAFAAEYERLKKISITVVSFKCDNLPEPDAIKAMTDKAELDKIGAELDAITKLYEALPIESKLQVTGYAKYTLDKAAYDEAMNAYNKQIAQNVYDLIEAIGYTFDGKVTMDYSNYESYKDAIDAARTAYDALNEDQKIKVSNITTLTMAEEDYSKWVEAAKEAETVKNMINGLTESIDRSNYIKERAAWNKADEAMKALSENANLFITGDETLKKAKVDENLKYVEAYMDVEDAIDKEIMKSGLYDSIVKDSAVDAEYALKIAELESKFNELSMLQKLEVRNYAALSEAKKAYYKNVDSAIAYIQEAIDKIDVANIVNDEATKEEFSKIADLINSLSDDDKSKIGSNDADTSYATRLIKFEAAQEKLSTLKTSDEVVEMIDKLGNTETLTEANLEACKKAVKEALDAYNALADSEKLKVTNFAALEEWNKAIENFVVDHRGDVNNDGKVDINDIFEMVQFVLGKKTPTAEEFERANIVKETDGKKEVIDIYDVLEAIDIMEF